MQLKENRHHSMALGVGLALLSACLFATTLPLVAWAGSGVGPFTTAALLYLGTGLAGLLQRLTVRDAGVPFSRGALPTIVLMAITGSALAPVLFVWGIQIAGPVTGGLLLNLEAVWSVLFARLVYGEFIGRRVAVALMLMFIGGLLFATRVDGELLLRPMGALAVVGATIAWAIDNTASRRVAEFKPLTVISVKAALGAVLTVSIAIAAGESAPNPWQTLTLLATGATGYGASLRFYLLAQRKVGAARTASLFALAPCLGAALGLIVAPSHLDLQMGVAATFFISGVALHFFERHAHAHHHAAAHHEHAHRHDDSHHTHEHVETVVGEHSHPHSHDVLEHTHDHALDVHHGHTH